MSPAQRERIAAEREAQGLPPRVEDPTVLARIAALIAAAVAETERKAGSV